MKKRTTTKPNLFVYYFFRLILLPIIRIRNRLRFDNHETKHLKGPCLILCNHPSPPDFLYAIRALGFKRRVNVVVARNYTYMRFLRRLLKTLAVIPKNLFNPDPETVKMIMRVIAAGGAVLMMPEGKLSSAGVIAKRPEGLEKLIKKLAVPVIMVNLKGAYYTSPKWSEARRHGQIWMKSKIILTTDDINEMTLSEINKTVNDNLYYDESEWLANNTHIKYKGRNLVAGLTSILYKCPKCHHQFSLIEHKNLIRCEECGSEYHLDNRYLFHNKDNSDANYQTISTWFNFQLEEAKKDLMAGNILETKVKLAVSSTREYHKDWQKIRGEGICRLDLMGLHFKGNIDGEEKDLHFSIAIMPTLLYGCKEDFEIYHDNKFYYFIPLENLKQTSMWSVYTEAAYDIYMNSEKQKIN